MDTWLDIVNIACTSIQPRSSSRVLG